MKIVRFAGVVGLFIGLFLFFSLKTLHAQILRPYIVDEKPQVIFGDSAHVGDYYGLENYTKEYRDGYAHITYTYTHAFCCYASYPPTLYVTNVDPRFSATSTTRFIDIPYMLGPGNPEDWYLFDLQFDATGYTILVLRHGTTEFVREHRDISGLQPTDFVALANQYTLQDPPVPYSMSFTPVRVTPAVPTGNSNVLFIPGLKASRLYESRGVTCDFLCEDRIWEPTSPLDVSHMYLNSSGLSIKNIYTKDILDTARAYGVFSVDIYKSLILNLSNLKTNSKINDWKAYAYDWRQGIDDLIQNGTHYEDHRIYLIDTLQALASTSQNGKVSIVAHSNGGLLAKALIKRLQELKALGQSNLIDSVDMVVLVASPQLGTPDAFSAILHGYEQSIPGGLMSDAEARKLAQNMPSAYILLPSKKYFDQDSIRSLGIFASTSLSIFQTTYGETLNSYTEQHNFVLGLEGRTQASESDLISPLKGNSLLLTQAESLHDSIDNMTFPASIKLIEIAGWGKETIGGIKYTGTDIEPIFTVRGDQTVVSASALYGSGTKYWLDLSTSRLSHKNILEDSQLLDFMDHLLVQTPLGFSTITETEPFILGDRLHLGVHSPVSIGVYDTLGNFTGKVCDDVTGGCAVQENIPGSSYYEFGEGKYVNLAKGNIQKAVLQGTDVGTFTFVAETVAPTGETSSSSFVDIPVTTQTQAEVTLNSTTAKPELKLDVTGDGVVDFTLTPNDTFDAVTYLQIMKATIDSLDLAPGKIKAFDNRVDSIIKVIQKGKIDKAKLKAEKFKAVLEKKLAKPDPKHPKPKKLSKTDAQLLLDMLNGLLDNIG